MHVLTSSLDGLMICCVRSLGKATETKRKLMSSYMVELLKEEDIKKFKHGTNDIVPLTGGMFSFRGGGRKTRITFRISKTGKSLKL